MTESNTPEPKGAKTKPVDVLIVRGPFGGRWRAGRHFGAAPVEIPVADLDKPKIAAIEGDPHLSVSRATR